MTLPLNWPRAYRPKSLQFQPDQPDRGGVQTIDGNEQVAASPGGRWTARLAFDVFGTPSNTFQMNRMLFWRAFAARMQGRVGRMLIGPFDWLSPADLAGVPKDVPVLFADGTGFGDGTRLQQSSVAAVLADAAAAQDQSITVAIDPGHVLQAGQYIGLGGCRLHMVTASQDLGATDGAGRPLFALALWPWLRAAYAVGADVETANPVCLMRFKVATTAALDIQAPFKSSPTVEFTEVF